MWARMIIAVNKSLSMKYSMLAPCSGGTLIRGRILMGSMFGNARLLFCDMWMGCIFQEMHVFSNWGVGRGLWRWLLPREGLQ